MATPGLNLITTAVDLLLSTAAVDTVAVISGFDQVLENARPVRATVRQPSRLLEHPLENGQVITDYSITMPAEIDLSVIVQAEYYRSTYQEVLSLFQTKEVLTVQLNVGTFVNMVIADIPHEETPEKFDAFEMIIRFKQILVVQTSPPFSPADPTQANTQAQGQQSAQTVAPVNPTVTPLNSNVAVQSGVDYSSVQNLQNSQYTISGVQTSSGTSTITNVGALPNQIPVTGVQTLTNSQSLSSVFTNPGIGP